MPAWIAGACTEICDHGNEVSRTLTDLRRELAKSDEAPHYVRERIGQMEEAGALSLAWRVSLDATKRTLCITGTQSSKGDVNALLQSVSAQWGETAHLVIDLSERLDLLVRWGSLGKLRELVAPLLDGFRKVDDVGIRRCIRRSAL